MFETKEQSMLKVYNRIAKNDDRKNKLLERSYLKEGILSTVLTV